MRIAFVSQGSPFTRSSWSGIPFFSLREVERRFGDVHVIDTPLVDRLIAKSGRLARLGWFVAREKPLTMALAAAVEAKLRRIQPDVVLSVGAPHKVADLHPRWRVVHVTDAMFASVVELYPKYRQLSRRSLRIGEALQRRLIDRAHGLLVCSDWAADSAAAHYNRPRERFTVAPMGANLEEEPPARPPRPAVGAPRLLFVGFDWARKGGPLALRIHALIRERLPGAELHIVGCTPAEALGREGVVVHGRFDKRNPAQAATLDELYATSHFFLMPSRQEAYGLVYCEACAYGLPSVATATGGVGTVVRHGVNGLLLPVDAGAERYAADVLALWADPARYTAAQRAAREDYERRLNWRAWGGVLESVLAAAPAAVRVAVKKPKTTDAAVPRLARLA